MRAKKISFKMPEGLEEGIKNFQSVQQKINEAIQKCEEETVIKVLTQYLGREPEMEDFKKCQKFTYENVFDSYELAYENERLGKIIYNLHGEKIGVTFEPENLLE